MTFTQIKDILAPSRIGKVVQTRGWVYRIRKHKDKVFIVIRDSSGIMQVVAKAGTKAFKDAEKLTIESSLEISGKVRKEDRAPTGYELDVIKITPIQIAETFPIARDLSEEFLRDVRHLWIRSRKLTSILKVRSEIFRAIHDFYHLEGFAEYQSPIFTTQACEGGSTLFEVKGFDKKIYLTQSWQLHAEAGIFALEKIYTVAPMFRAEKSRTTRHLAECWLAEAEAAWMSFEDLLKHEERLILHVVQHVLKSCKRELKELGRDTKELESLKAPFARIKYADAIKKLGEKWGYDLTDKDERKLVAQFGRPVFLTHFPREMKAFYMKPDPKEPKTVLGVDLLAPGIGEISGGSERVESARDLKSSLKLFKLKEKDYSWYMDLRKYGGVPHSGFGLGIERLVMWLTGTEHIMDTIPFPRTMARTYP